MKKQNQDYYYVFNYLVHDALYLKREDLDRLQYITV